MTIPPHLILSGDTHLVVVEGDTTFRYCRETAAEVLDRAQSQLDDLRQQLGI
ncbi:hypothetical protein MAV101_02540 [Mycobacterium avium subsp. hominissuis 101]|nr:hypothetical protein MAV101_02540 [Mycobacterium avium subsp. hominissuis 101]